MTDFDKDKNKQAGNGHYAYPEGQAIFKEGADWGKKWYDDKGVGHLTEWMKSTKYKRVEKLEGVIRFCAGLISTMDAHKNKHPEEVEQWIYDNAQS